MEKLCISWMAFSEPYAEPNNIHSIEDLSRFGFSINCLFGPDCDQSSLLLISGGAITCDKIIRFIINIRRTMPHIPTILIGHSNSIVRAELLTKGVDDVVPPDIHPIELYARMIGLHKRYDKGQYIKKIGNFHIDYLERNIVHDDINIPLKPREYLLLEYLIKYSPKPISRNHILLHLWNCKHDPGTNSIEVHIWRLRKKMMEYAPNAPQIQTIKNKGYAISVERNVKSPTEMVLI